MIARNGFARELCTDDQFYVAGTMYRIVNIKENQFSIDTTVTLYFHNPLQNSSDLHLITMEGRTPIEIFQQ